MERVADLERVQREKVIREREERAARERVEKELLLERAKREEELVSRKHGGTYHLNSVDEYGRKRRRGPAEGRRECFTGTMPDNPFGVNHVEFETLGQFSDQPVLQFWTWKSQFYLLRNEDATERSRPGRGLVRCDVADKNGDWCGHVVVSEDWLPPPPGGGGRLHHFIALSDAKSFSKDECLNWTHYIPREPEDVEWDLFFVLLIEWNHDRLLWERVGMGKVFQAAFDLQKWDEILLG